MFEAECLSPRFHLITRDALIILAMSSEGFPPTRGFFLRSIRATVRKSPKFRLALNNSGREIYAELTSRAAALYAVA